MMLQTKNRNRLQNTKSGNLRLKVTKLRAADAKIIGERQG